MNIKVKKLSSEAVLPSYATEGSSGFDLFATEDVLLGPGETVLVKTGLAMAIPKGYELQVRPRSGLSLKTHLRVANSPGTVDSDYRGEICVIVTNSWHFQEFSEPAFDIFIRKGHAIAQGVICPVIIPETFEVVDSLDETVRGECGFGSTDKPLQTMQEFIKSCQASAMEVLTGTQSLQNKLRTGKDSDILTQLEQVIFFLQANGIYYEEGSNNGITPFIFLHFDDNGKATKE